DLARAIGHYREALRLDPEQAVWRAELGTLLVREGQVADGLGELTQAASQAPDEPAIIDLLVRGLCRAGRAGEALQGPRDARFRQLYQAFRFRRLPARQRAERRAAIIWNNEDGPTLLPFLRIDAPVDRPGERQDKPHALPGPHHRRPARRPDWKHG